MNNNQESTPTAKPLPPRRSSILKNPIVPASATDFKHTNNGNASEFQRQVSYVSQTQKKKVTPNDNNLERVVEEESSLRYSEKQNFDATPPPLLVRSHNTEDDDEEEDLQESVDLDELENSIRIDGPDADMSGGSASMMYSENSMREIKKTYLQFQNYKDIKYRYGTSMVRARRKVLKLLLKRGFVITSFLLTSLYCICKVIITTATFNILLQSDTDSKFTSMKWLFSLDIVALSLLAVESCLNYFGFSVYYIRAPRVIFLLFFALLPSIVLTSLNLSEFSSLDNLKHPMISYFVDQEQNVVYHYRVVILTLYNLFGVAYCLIKFFDLRDIYNKKVQHETQNSLSSMESLGSSGGNNTATKQGRRKKASQLPNDESEHEDFGGNHQREREVTKILVEQVFHGLKRMVVVKQGMPGSEAQDDVHQIQSCVNILDKLLTYYRQPKPQSMRESSNQDSQSSQTRYNQNSGVGQILGVLSQIRVSSLMKNAENQQANFIDRGYQLNPQRHNQLLQNYSYQIYNVIGKLDVIDFNIFELQRLTGGKEFMIIGWEVAIRSKLLEKNNIHSFTFINFLDGLGRCYNEMTVAPYHSRTHAADVLQALHVFLGDGKLADLLQLSPIEHLGAIIAALAHDVDHPGLSNGFLVNSVDEMALLYNDQSVLENHHVAQTFLLLRDEDLNILKNFNWADYRKIREIIIKMVLATDMANHNTNLNVLRQLTDKIDVNERQSNNQFHQVEEDLRTNSKVFLLGQALHIADITNPCRDWYVCQRWTDLVFREFFTQGDLERSMNMQISMLMDRKTTNIASSQVSFIDFVVEPTMREFGKLCRGIRIIPNPSNNSHEQAPTPPNTTSLIARLRQTRANWDGLRDVFEQYKELNNMTTVGDLHVDHEFFSYENYKKRRQAREAKAQTQSNSESLQHHSHEPEERKEQISESPFMNRKSKRTIDKELFYAKGQSRLQAQAKKEETSSFRTDSSIQSLDSLNC